MKKFKLLSVAIMGSLFINGCSTPATVNSNNQTNTQTSSTKGEFQLNVETKAAFASMYENEGIFHDSEIAASQQNSFNTKGLLGDVLSGVGTVVKKTLDGVGNVIGTSLDLSTDVLASLGRTDFLVKVSAVTTTTNSDGSTTKTVSVDFTSKVDNKTKTDTIAKTFTADGNTNVQHSITVDFDNYGKVANRTITNSSGQKTVNSNSSSKFASGATVNITESRIGNSGSGNIVIKSSSGVTTNYSFTSSVDANGMLTLAVKDANNATANIVEKSASVATVTTVSGSVDLNTSMASETYTNAVM